MDTVNNTSKDILTIAIPSENPGGLDAAIGQHFGHCDIYTIVEAQNGKILEVRTLPNVPHQQGGCMAPVNHLAQNGVKVLIAGGMGMRPLMGFQQVGVRVYHGSNAPTVGLAVHAFLMGSLPPFSTEFTCGGGK
jgi:predicted Fe-Mo cluster-binding NifX family protein